MEEVLSNYESLREHEQRMHGDSQLGEEQTPVEEGTRTKSEQSDRIRKRALKEEKMDVQKQTELQQLKNTILAQKQHDLIKGYTEVLIGEKLKSYENEEELQISLQRIQRDIRQMVKDNMDSIKEIDPKSVQYRNTQTIDQQIDSIERSLKNPFYFQLAQIWEQDHARRSKEKACFSPKKNKSPMAARHEQVTEALSKNLTEAPLDESMRSNSKSKAHLMFATREAQVNSRFSELQKNQISQRNLHLLNNSQAMVLERKEPLSPMPNVKFELKTARKAASKAEPKSPTKAELRKQFSIRRETKLMGRSLNSKRDSPNKRERRESEEEDLLNQFASPLNVRLEKMKKTLHNLMYNTSMSHSLMKGSFQGVIDRLKNDGSSENTGQTESQLKVRFQKDQMNYDYLRNQISEDLKEAGGQHDKLNSEIISMQGHLMNMPNNNMSMQFLPGSEAFVSPHQLNQISTAQFDSNLNIGLIESRASHHASQMASNIASNLASHQASQKQGQMVPPQSTNVNIQGKLPTMIDLNPQSATRSLMNLDSMGPNTQPATHNQPSLKKLPPDEPAKENIKLLDGSLPSPDEQAAPPQISGSPISRNQGESKFDSLQTNQPNFTIQEEGSGKKIIQINNKKSDLIDTDQTIEDGTQDRPKILSPSKSTEKADNLNRNNLNQRSETLSRNQRDDKFKDDSHLPDQSSNGRKGSTTAHVQRSSMGHNDFQQELLIDGETRNFDVRQTEMTQRSQFWLNEEEELQLRLLEAQKRIEFEQLKGVYESHEFKDKEFEGNFKALAKRLNGNLGDYSRGDLMVANIEEDIDNMKKMKEFLEERELMEIARNKGKQAYFKEKNRRARMAAQSPFKSSHISHIQSLISQRDKFAQRLKSLHSMKAGVKSHREIQEHMMNMQKSFQNIPNTGFGPIDLERKTNFSSNPTHQQLAQNTLHLLNQPSSPMDAANSASNPLVLSNQTSQMDDKPFTNIMNNQSLANFTIAGVPSITRLNDLSPEQQAFLQQLGKEGNRGVSLPQFSPQITGTAHFGGVNIEAAQKTMQSKIDDGIKKNQQNYHRFMRYLKQFKQKELLDDKSRRRVSFLRARGQSVSSSLPPSKPVGIEVTPEQDAQTIIQRENFTQLQKMISDGSFSSLPLEQQTYLISNLNVNSDQRDALLQQQQQVLARVASKQQAETQVALPTTSNEEEPRKEVEVKILTKAHPSKEGTASDSNQMVGIQEIYEKAADNSMKAVLKDIVTDPSNLQSQELDDRKGGSELTRTLSGLRTRGVEKSPGSKTKNKIYDSLFNVPANEAPQFVVTGEAVQNDASKVLGSSAEFSKSQEPAPVIRSKYSPTQSNVKDKREKPMNFEFTAGQSGKNSKTAMQGYDEMELTQERPEEHKERVPVEFNKTLKTSEQAVNQALSGDDSKLSKMDIKLKPKITHKDRSMVGFSEQPASKDHFFKSSEASKGYFPQHSGAFKLRSNQIQLSAEFQEANKLSRQAQIHSHLPSNKAKSPQPAELATQFRSFNKPNQIMILPDLAINSPLYINKMQVKAGYTQRQSLSKHFTTDVKEEKAGNMITDSKTNVSKEDSEYKGEVPKKVSVYQKRDPRNILSQNFKDPITVERSKDVTQSQQEATLKQFIRKQNTNPKTKVPGSPDGLHIDNIVNSDIKINSAQNSGDKKAEISVGTSGSPHKESGSGKSQSQLTMKPLVVTKTGDHSAVIREPGLIPKVTGITQTPVLDFLSNDPNSINIMEDNQESDNFTDGSRGQVPQAIQTITYVNRLNKDAINSSGSYMMKKQPLGKNPPHINGAAHPSDRRTRNMTTLMEPYSAKGIMNINEKGGADALDFLSQISPAHILHKHASVHRKGGKLYRSKRTMKDSIDSFERRMKHAAHGSLYTLGLHDQSHFFQINSATKLRNDRLKSGQARGVDQSVQNEIGEEQLQQDRILVKTQESENGAKEHQDDMRGSQLEFEHITTINPQYNLTHQELLEGKKFRSNDPRAIYMSAKREQQLIDKRKQIQEQRERKKEKKGSTKEGRFQTVRMNNILTLEQLLDDDVSTEKVKPEKQLPFIIGPKTQMIQKGETHMASASHSSITQNPSAIMSQQSQPRLGGKDHSLRLMTSGVSIKDTLRKEEQVKTSKDKKNIKAYISRQSSQGSGLQDNTTSKLDNIYQYQKSGSAHNEEQLYANLMNFNLPKIVSQEKLKMETHNKSTVNTPFVKELETPNPMESNIRDIVLSNTRPQEKKKGPLNLTLQPFKQILITNPWGEKADPKKSTNNDKIQSTLVLDNNLSSQQQFLLSSNTSKPHHASKSQQRHALKTSTRVSPQGVKIMPAGGFKSISPSKTHQKFIEEKKSQLGAYKRQAAASKRASISSGKIQGFGRSSGAENNPSLKVGAGEILSPMQIGPPPIISALAPQSAIVSPKESAEPGMNTNVPDINSNQDFTIEEKLIEESYISKENINSSMMVAAEDSKTIEMKRTYLSPGGKMVFVDPSQTQQHDKGKMISLNSTQQAIEPKIKIENNIGQVYQSMDISKDGKLGQ